MKKLLATLSALATAVSLTAQEVPPCKGCRELPTHFDFFPAGATVTPALLFADVVKGEAFDKAGFSKCDFILGLDTPDGGTVDLWDSAKADVFRGNLEREARGRGAYLKVLKRTVATLPDGKTGDTYELRQPQAKLVLNPTPGKRAISATVFTLIVTDVTPHSAAEALGLKSGDLLYTINGENALKMSSTVEANEAMKNAVRDNAGKLNLQFVRCEPREEGYVLHRQNPITLVVSQQAGTP